MIFGKQVIFRHPLALSSPFKIFMWELVHSIGSSMRPFAVNFSVKWGVGVVSGKGAFTIGVGAMLMMLHQPSSIHMHVRLRVCVLLGWFDPIIS